MGRELISREAPWRRTRIVVRVPAPAAGADWSQVVPGGHTYRPLAVFGQLVTSAAVATRAARLSFGDGDITFGSFPPATTQVASLTRLYSWAPSQGPTFVGTAIGQYLPDLTLQAGWTIGSVTELIDVADQWSSVFLLVEDTWVRDGSVDIDQIPAFAVEVIDSRGA